MKIVSIKFGSHLYGTATPASDLDFKTVLVPPARDILLQRARATTQNRREKLHGEKNQPGDVDEEAFGLHRYLGLLAEGQTVALDMLFAPRWSMTAEPSSIWREIVAERHHLVSRKAASFVGYCRTQANKYGIRGSRVHAVRNLVEWFDEAITATGHLTRLSEVADTLPGWIAGRAMQHTAIVAIPQPGDRKPMPHLECCNRKAPLFSTLKDGRAIYARLLEQYGERALAAERNEGVDWKALSHAVRVGREALEFLATSWITFPLTYADHILAIKQGRIEYAEVADEIENLLIRVEAAEKTSGLPAAPNQAFIDDLICRVYGAGVCCAMALRG